MVEIEPIVVKNLAEAVTKVLKLQTDGGNDCSLWFRGQRCHEHSLIAKLQRTATSPDAVFDRERRLLVRFRQRSLPFWPAGYPQDQWEHLFAMQHHGVPTRLLDWSENLFVAIYFAVQEAAVVGHITPCSPTVWVLDPVKWNKNVTQHKDIEDTISVLTTGDDELLPYAPAMSESKLERKRQSMPVALYGTHNSARIVAQRGTFTVAGKVLTPMNEFAESPLSISKLTLQGPIEKWRRSLQTVGITESMVFPDLSGLARELEASEGW